MTVAKTKTPTVPLVGAQRARPQRLPQQQLRSACDRVFSLSPALHPILSTTKTLLPFRKSQHPGSLLRMSPHLGATGLVATLLQMGTHRPSLPRQSSKLAKDIAEREGRASMVASAMTRALPQWTVAMTNTCTALLAPPPQSRTLAVTFLWENRALRQSWVTTLLRGTSPLPPSVKILPLHLSTLVVVTRRQILTQSPRPSTRRLSRGVLARGGAGKASRERLGVSVTILARTAVTAAVIRKRSAQQERIRCLHRDHATRRTMSLAQPLIRMRHCDLPRRT